MHKLKICLCLIFCLDFLPASGFSQGVLPVNSDRYLHWDKIKSVEIYYYTPNIEHYSPITKATMPQSSQHHLITANWRWIKKLTATINQFVDVYAKPTTRNSLSMQINFRFAKGEMETLYIDRVRNFEYKGRRWRIKKEYFEELIQLIEESVAIVDLKYLRSKLMDSNILFKDPRE